MSYRSIPLLAFLLALLAGGPAHAAPALDRIPNQYVVVLSEAEPDVEQVAANLARRHGLTRGHTYRHALKGFSSHVPPGRLAALAADPRVTIVALDRLLTLETSVEVGGQGMPTGV